MMYSPHFEKTLLGSKICITCH